MRAASTSRGARRGGLALADQGLVSITNFLTGVLIGKFGGEAALGVYALCFSIVYFVSELQQRMLATPYMVFLHRKRAVRRGEYLGSTLVQFVLSSAAAAVGLAAYGGYLAWTQGGSAMTASVWVLVAAGPAFLLREFLRNVAFAHLQLRSAIVGDAIVFAAQLGGLALLAWLGRLTVPAVFVVVGIATAASSLAWVIVRPLPVAVSRRRIGLHWLQNWRYSQWLVFGRMLGSFSRLAMPWIVLWAADELAVSQWAACHGLVGMSWVFIRGVSNYLRPLTITAYARLGAPGMLRIMWCGLALFVGTLGSMAVVLWLAGDWLLTVVYRPEYAVAATAVTVLGLNAVVTAMGMTVSNALSAVCDTRSQFWGEAVTLAVTLGSAWPLASRYGVTGAAFSFLAGAAASLCYMAIMLGRDLRGARSRKESRT